MTRGSKARAAFVSFLALGILTLGAMSASAQNVSPFGGVGNVQLLDQNGIVCPNCVLYSYQAGTTTQQSTFTDATGLTLNPNPIPFNGSGRAAIWLSNFAFYKFVLCLQNDGPTCTAGDTLFVVDQVPGSPSSQQQGNAFTGTFTSATANAASSGILRLASGDSICWRNAANSGNLCLSKDGTDILGWPGVFKCTEGGAPSGQAGFDIWWCDAASHRMKHTDNNTTAAQFVNSGVDINTSDQVIQFHFGATATPLAAIAPTVNQVLGWDGAHILGVTPTATPATCTTATPGFALTYNPPTWSCTEIIPPVLKKGSNGGNYVSATGSFAAVDGTNLKDVVTIPTGSNLVVTANGVMSPTGGASTWYVALFDGASKLTEETLTWTAAGASNSCPGTMNCGAENFSLSYVIAGDGASHTIQLEYAVEGASNDTTGRILNTGGIFPTMLFTLQ